MLNLTYQLLALSKFYDYVLPEIQGYVKSLVDQELRASAIDFCIRTRLWQETVSDTIVANIAEYTLDYPGEARFHEVREVLIDGVPISPFTPEQNTLENPKWRTETGTVGLYTVVDEGGILLHRIPDTGGQALQVDAVFVPTQDATRLPSFLLERHITAIAKGAKYRLMQMGKKPWTDRELSIKYEQDVNVEIGREAFIVAKGKTRLPARVETIHKVR